MTINQYWGQTLTSGQIHLFSISIKPNLRLKAWNFTRGCTLCYFGSWSVMNLAASQSFLQFGPHISYMFYTVPQQDYCGIKWIQARSISDTHVITGSDNIIHQYLSGQLFNHLIICKTIKWRCMWLYWNYAFKQKWAAVMNSQIEYFASIWVNFFGGKL